MYKHACTITRNRCQFQLLAGAVCKFSRCKSGGPSRVTKGPPRTMAESVKVSKWMEIGQYSVFPWSIAGVETCVVVKGENLNVAFDMGYAVRESVKCQHVFISHGHIDHVGGILPHASHRALTSLPRAHYYLLPHLVEPTRTIASAVAQSHGPNGQFAELQLHPVTAEDTIQLPGGYIARPFPTHHRTPSQGYILYRKRLKLKPDYQGLLEPEIGRLVKEGVNVHDEVVSPEIAYTGDTTFEVFTSPSNPDLLKVKLLITESTYLDNETDKQGRSGVEKARVRGHCDLLEFVEHERIFADVENIVLVHISDKYSPGYIKRTAQSVVPHSLLSKLHLATFMKETVQ